VVRERLLDFGIEEQLSTREALLAYQLLTSVKEFIKLTKRGAAPVNVTALAKLPLVVFKAWWKRYTQLTKPSQRNTACNSASIFSALLGRKHSDQVETSQLFRELYQFFYGKTEVPTNPAEAPSIEEPVYINHYLPELHGLRFKHLCTSEPAFLDELVASGFQAVWDLQLIHGEFSTQLELRWDFEELEALVLNQGKLEECTAKDRKCLTEIVQLSDNRLKCFPVNLLTPLEEERTGIRSLNLAGNPLQVFPFTQAYHLSNLDLSRCNLVEVPAALLANLPQLSHLNLSFNRLTKLPDFTTGLVKLDVSCNLLTELSEFHCERLVQLIEVDLSHNQLKNLTFKLSSAHQVENLNVAYNPLESLTFYGPAEEYWEYPVAPPMTQDEYTLHTLQAFGRTTTSDCPTWFNQLSFLRTDGTIFHSYPSSPSIAEKDKEFKLLREQEHELVAVYRQLH